MTTETLFPSSREEWLDLRKSTIGASEVAAILGANPWQTPYELWARKIGLLPPADETMQMRRGKLLEPVAIDLLREERPDWTITPNSIPGGAFYRDLEAGISCTPDLHVTAPDRPGTGTCEIKTVNQHIFHQEWMIDGDIEVPAYVAIQVLQTMALAGASWCCVAPIVGFDLDIHVIDIDPHPGILARIRDAAKDFWRRVREKDPYQPDYARDGAVIKRLYAGDDGGTIDLSGNERALKLVAAREGLNRIEAAGVAAAKERKIVDAEIIDLLGNCALGSLGDGRVIEANTIRRQGFIVKPTAFRKVTIHE